MGDENFDEPPNNVMEPWMIEPPAEVAYIPKQLFKCIRTICVTFLISKAHLKVKLLCLAFVIIVFAQGMQLNKMKQKNTELTLELAALQRDYAEQTETLHEQQNLSKIYQGQLTLISMIGKQIDHMHTCYSKLQSYSTLRQIGATWRSEEDNKIMSRLADYLGCDRELSPSYYLRIKESFNKRINSCFDFKNVQIELALKGDYEKMKAEQQRTKHLPAKTCHFVCHLEEKQSNWFNEAIQMVIAKLFYSLVY